MPQRHQVRLYSLETDRRAKDRKCRDVPEDG